MHGFLFEKISEIIWKVCYTIEGYYNYGVKRMNYLKKIFRLIFVFIDKLQKAHIGAYAAQAAYFTVLSGIPLLMLLLALIQYTPLTKGMLLEMFSSVVPSILMPFIVAIMEEVYTKSVTLISVTAVVAFWSAARGVLAITCGFNNIYNIRETRNYFVLRLRSSVYTFFLLIAVVFAMMLIVFSEQRLEFLGENFPVIKMMTDGLKEIRFVLVFIVEFLMFIIIYKLMPNRKGSLFLQIPGALFAATGWSGFSYFFSAYVDKFSNMSYMYGSLTTVIVFMLWIYFLMYILLLGAGINACVEKYPQWRKWDKYMRNQEYLKKDGYEDK